ncbi:hypothetical protein WR25_19993 [Diploscapter pachys]|uniref:Uncharacterized protein n=1 Tax=Diploscapter pachys TaxID=2018661 RepID=A0A2A2LE21_9BILA|nr:hypothetical protein WR25_19993 [Diploscapter pachys]
MVLCAILVWIVIVCGIIFAVRKYLWSLRISDLTGKTSVISGCDTGFGYLLALRLVSLGLPVIAGCYTEKGAENLKKASRHSSLLKTYNLDVSKNDSVEKFKDFVAKETGNKGIWAAVANAGILGATGPDDWLNADDYINTMQVNTFGVIRFIQAMKKFVKKQRGRVVIIASVSGRTPRPTVGPYCVSKHAVEAYGDVIRHELCDFNVKVSILEPGFFSTDITQTATKDLDDIWARLDKETKDEYGQTFFDDYKHSRFSRLSHCSSELTPVIDAYEHAILSVYPKSR